MKSRKRSITSLNLASYLVEPVSTYLELTLGETVKAISECNSEGSKPKRTRKNSGSFMSIARSQRVSPEVAYQMREVRPALQPRVTLIA